MKSLTIAALCAGLAAIPLAAKAAELVLIDATGRPVAVLVPATAPLDMPGFPSGLFAQQEALMNRMMQTMEAGFDGAPIGLSPAEFASVQPGSTIVATSFSDGHDSCSRMITYEQHGNAAPVMKVSQTGDGCDALPAPGRTVPVPAAAPERAPAPAPDRVAPEQFGPTGPNLIRVSYRRPTPKPALHHG